MGLGYHQERKWWGKGGRIAAFFAGRSGFIRLASVANKSLLGSSNNDFGSYNQFDKDYTGEFEDIRKRNFEFDEKLHELRRTMDDLKTKNAARDKFENEKMERTSTTMMAEIEKTTDRIAVLEGKFVNKTKYMEKMSEIEKRTAVLEEQIKKLKDRFIYLEVNSIQNTPVGCTSQAPLSDLDQIEEMEKLPLYDDLYTWLIFVIFGVGFLIGMHI